MSASWEGKVRLADCDAKPGHYYVTVKSRGKVAFALGPFTQTRPGKDAHARALGLVRSVRRYVSANDHSRYEPWYEYGTSRIPLEPHPPEGKLNAAIVH